MLLMKDLNSEGPTKDCLWSSPVAATIEISATFPTVKLLVAMSALEKAVLKVDDRLRVYC